MMTSSRWKKLAINVTRKNCLVRRRPSFRVRGFKSKQKKNNLCFVSLIVVLFYFDHFRYFLSKTPYLFQQPIVWRHFLKIFPISNFIFHSLRWALKSYSHIVVTQRLLWLGPMTNRRINQMTWHLHFAPVCPISLPCPACPVLPCLAPSCPHNLACPTCWVNTAFVDLHLSMR